MTRYRLVVEVQEKGWPSGGIARLRLWLKGGLRGYGIVCKEIEGVSDERNSSEIRDEKPLDIDN